MDFLFAKLKHKNIEEDKVMKQIIRIAVFVILGMIMTVGCLLAQHGDIRPAIVGQPIHDFTLPQFQGGDISLSSLKGKNIMILFPRGLAGEDHWCHICNYQYAELVELDKEKQIRNEYDLEIFYVFPYTKEMIGKWIDTFPAQMADIEGWKHPENPDALDERGKRRLAFARSAFPKTFEFKKGELPMPFPILIDGERTVSKGLGLFTEDWGGSQIDQNVPTVFIIDKQGIVWFKYYSQNTFDRPEFDYLMRIMDCMIKE